MAWTVDSLEYTTRRKLTIDQTKVDADLTDFPVLVKLTSANFDFAKANADGFDIRFTSSDGSTLLKYERERHDNTNSLAEYWVKVPVVDDTVDTDFYIYYRTTDTTDGADPTNVWDANHLAVYHLKDITTSAIDDSTTVNDGTKKAANEPIETDGKIAKAQDVDGTNDRIIFANNIIGTGAFTLEVWFKTDTITGDWHAIMGRLSNTSSTGTGLIQLNNALYGIYNGSGSTAWESYLTTPIETAAWYYAAVSFDGLGANKTGRLYMGGAEVANHTGTTVQGAMLFALGMGRESASDYFGPFNGIIDEARVSNIVRTAEWIKASYNSEADTLLTYGSEDTGAITHTVTVSDTLSLADTVTKQTTYLKTIIDTLSLTDTISTLRSFFVTVADTIGLTDVITKLTTFKQTIVDTISLTDVVSAGQKFFLTIADTIHLTDVISKVLKFGVVVSDTLHLTDAVSIVSSAWTWAEKHTSSFTYKNKSTTPTWGYKTKSSSPSWTYKNKS